jgi:tetratricopeptide (TPR) repeat protein
MKEIIENIENPRPFAGTVAMEPASSSKGSANLVKEGEKLFVEGDLEGARLLFERAAGECPGNVQALNNLAVVSLAGGDRQTALRHLREASEIKPDFLEARHNLAELYVLENKWKKAAKELEAILGFKPGDIPTVKRLAGLYASMGEEAKAKELLDGTGNIREMKDFINSLWLGIKFYSMAEDMSVRERLEKLMLAVLKLIDGQDGRSMAYKLVGTDPSDGGEVVLEKLAENFYYRESGDLGDAPGTLDEEENPKLILAISDSDDWKLFHDSLKAEMRAEGGCLGDFTQTKKVFKRTPELRRYDLDETLKYFQANLGPCDCHVARASLD